MKYLAISLIVLLCSCSEAPEQEREVVKPQPKLKMNNSVIKGFQDKKQKAKDMEAEMLKAVEKQRKAIDG